MPTPKPKSGYKTKRKYGCPYCEVKLPRSELVPHVQDEHEIMIPEGYTAARVVYDKINGKNYGTCMICGAKVYEWDDRVWRYKNLCNNHKCREILREKSKQNHLDDPEKQKLMLSHRKISGEYKFRDGGKRGYVGSYERKTLEFMDRVMNIPSKDIETPGPTFSYEYEGNTHAFITDIFYIPAMLVIDVKDGGDNPNNRPMESYREKQVEKEKAVIEDGKFNYLRLTNNDFGQLMSAIADIRYSEMVNDPKKGIYINEGSGPSGGVMIGSVKPGGRNYIISGYPLHNVFDGYGERDDHQSLIFGNTSTDKALALDPNGEILIDSVQNLLEATRPKGMDPNKKKVTIDRNRKIVFNKDNSNMAKLADKLHKDKLKKKEKEKSKAMQELSMASILATGEEGRILSYSDLFRLEDTTIVDLDDSAAITEATVETMGAIRSAARDLGAVFNEEYIRLIGKYMSLMQDEEGFYISSEDPKYMITSPYYSDDEEIPQDMIDTMDNIYIANRNRKEDGGHE